MANAFTFSTKRKEITGHNHQQHDEAILLPGLPDQIAQLCLSFINPSLLYSSSNSIEFFNFDPISPTWHLLPPPPPLHHVLLHHPSFISRNFPIQSVSVSHNLILLAATTHNFAPALSHPLIFNPLSKTWSFGPPLSTPRRWCAAGAVRGTVYVASGIGSHFSNDTACSLEKWDHDHQGEWKRKSSLLKNGRFSREAIDAVGWRGKLYMVHVKAKEGMAYNVDKDEWEEMPEGMLRGWKGPVAAMDEDVMYLVDEAKGALRSMTMRRICGRRLWSQRGSKGHNMWLVVVENCV